MLVGTASVAELATEAPTIATFRSDPVVFDGVTCFQMTCEMYRSARESVLPPSLHPTVPAALTLQAWQVESSEWGPFRMVIARISCRSGVRARGFTSGVVADSEAAVAGLRETLGFGARPGVVDFRSSYDGVDLMVGNANGRTLAVRAIDPEPMGMDDVQYTGTLNLAYTPNGLRLVQVEAQHQPNRVDRLRATLDHFDPAAWGNARLSVANVASASVTQGTVTFPGIRFVCKTDELAFTGTEAVVKSS